MNIHQAPRAGIKEEIDKDTSSGVISLILGIVGIFLVNIPSSVCVGGIAGCVIGIILGKSALHTRGKWMAIAGILFSSIGLILAIVNVIQNIPNIFG